MKPAPSPFNRSRTSSNWYPCSTWKSTASTCTKSPNSVYSSKPGGCSIGADDAGRLGSQLALEERLANGGKFVGPAGNSLLLGESRVAVFDSVTGKVFFDVAQSGSHIGVLQRHGLPTVFGRFVCGFLEATNDGRLLFRPLSATFPDTAFGLPGNVLDLIRGTGVSIPGGF